MAQVAENEHDSLPVLTQECRHPRVSYLHPLHPAAAKCGVSLAQGDHLPDSVEQRVWISQLGCHIDLLKRQIAFDEFRGWGATREAGVGGGVPLHGRPDAVAVEQVEVVAHADLIAIVDDGGT